MEGPTSINERRNSYSAIVRSTSLARIAVLTTVLFGALLLPTRHDEPQRLRSSFDRSLQEGLSNDTCTLQCCSGLDKAELCPSENAWLEAIPFALQIIFIIVLISLSALFSGLTLGLLGLDVTGLEIVMEGDDEARAEEARKVYSVRKNGNLLLCTLLLGNVAVNAFLSILMGEYFGGIVGLLGSTIMIVIFGEIIPQALCARYALQIGSRTVPLVRVIVFLFYPFSAPLAFILNKTLGNELPTTYSSAELSKLLQIHVKEGRFDQETAEAMTGALKYKDTTVKEVMTSIDHTYMLNVDERLNFETIATIFKTGYSRIPVFEVSKNNIIGLLFVKDLIFIDPEDETPVRSFVQIFGRGVHVVWPDDKLGEVLRELKKGKSHMALVRDVNNDDETQDPFYEIKGIITLEDIIEEIIGGEIVDETDAFVDGQHLVKVDRMENFDWGRLRLLDAKIVEQRLSLDEIKAVVAHLRANYTASFELLSDVQLQRLVAETSVDELPTATHDVGQELPNDLMYETGVKCDECTLILSGKVTVLAGADRFRSDVSSWSVLGATVFTDVTYKPDFTAFVSSGPCRCLRLTKERFDKAVDASAVERMTPVAPLIPPPVVDFAPEPIRENSAKLEIKPEPIKKGEETKSRRVKLIDALQRKASQSVIMETNEEDGGSDTVPKMVDFASDGGLNSILTAGGTYMPKPVSSRSAPAEIPPAKGNDSQIEYLEST